MRARVSLCTRSTAASAVRPLRSPPRACAPSPGHGEHAVGFEHRAMLALEGHFAARQHVVDRHAQRAERLGQPPHFLRLSSLKRLVTTTRGSCSTTWPRPMPSLKDSPVDATGRVRSSSWPGWVSRDERSPVAIISASTMAGGFERLDLVLAIGALRAVLHDQNAERAAGAQNRHAEEGVVDSSPVSGR
jgi:hypothetical protein